MSQPDTEIFRIITEILSTLETLKVSIPPLIKNDQHAMDVLAAHEKAITSLMEKTLGTKEEHARSARNLEILSGKIDLMEAESRAHQPVHEVLEDRLETIENRELEAVYERVAYGKASGSDLETIKNALRSDPNDEYLLGLQTLILKQLGKEHEALEIIEESVAKNPKSAYLWYVHALLLDKSESEKKLSYFSTAISLLNEDQKTTGHNIYLSQTWVLYGLERLDEALISAEKAVEYSPDCPNAWHLKASVLTDLNRIPEALGSFAKALELDPRAAPSWFGKGTVLAILGRDHYDEALECFDKSIQLGPELSGAYFAKGKLLWMMGQPSKALVFYDQGLQRDPKEPCALCQRGIILQGLDRPKEALESFDDALKIGLPDNCQVANLAKIEVLLKLNCNKEAREVANAVDASKMESPNLLNALAWSLYEFGEFKKGAEIARKAIEKDPDSAHTWDTLACNLEGMKLDSEALEAFQKAKSLAKSDKSVTWEVYARLCEQMGKSQDAAEAKRKARLGSN